MSNINKKFKFTIISLIVFTIVCGIYLIGIVNEKKTNKVIVLENQPPCLELYNLIEKSSDSFNIPKYILYNVAYLETRYQGPFDWSYNPYLTSSAGAVGPMQIIPRYAPKFAGRPVTAKELRNNLKLNVEVSCKMLKSLYETYGRWDLVLGYYNTGYPKVNEYASYGSSNKDYTTKWIGSD